MVAVAALLFGCSHTPKGGFIFSPGETTNTWRLRYIDFEQIAKDYVAAHHIDFDIGQLRPSLYIWCEGDRLVAQVFYETRTGEPNLHITINEHGKVTDSRVDISRD